MTDERPAKRRRQRPDEPADSERAASVCKTCSSCRRRKIRCDSQRPRCRACVASGAECVYVEDTRRLARPSWPVLHRLEQDVATLWQRVQDAESRATHPAGSSVDVPDDQHQQHAAGPIGLQQQEQQEQQQQPPPLSIPANSSNGVNAAVTSAPAPTRPAAHAERIGREDESIKGAGEPSELSPQEVSLVGLVQAHNGAVSVHGVSSLLHSSNTRLGHTQSDPSAASRDQDRTTAQARVVSNAALQRQSESRLFRPLGVMPDLDGLDADTARHLFDLHWNRQHLAYLLTYRPAIMQSLSTGGPWANKLLLNAIYYSSSVYSDRVGLKPTADGFSTPGRYFFDRFRQLLVDALVEPSVTSAAALLLMGSNMASQGNLSAGWNFCGLAYRMIIDLGVHLTTGSRHTGGASTVIHAEIEREMRMRLYWGAFIIDTTQSMYFGRPTSLPLAEARMPIDLLDTYEELEEWTPYVDPTTNLSSDKLLLGYMPQPAYAVSTFSCLARLFCIGSRIIRLFYGLESVRLASDRAKDLKIDLETELSRWAETLPDHLRFKPDSDPTPPPHQITPHTSYHTLVILIKRPFFTTGHLQHCTSNDERAKDAHECVESALMIWKLVAAYRTAFTLRRAAYLLAYAMYSALVVLLAHSKDDRGQYSHAVQFFWSALSEQKQWFAGLSKPMAIIRDTMNEFGQMGMATQDPQQNDRVMDDLMQMLSDAQPEGTTHHSHAPYVYGTTGPAENFSSIDPACLDFFENSERLLTDDSLYGLFAPY